MKDFEEPGHLAPTGLHLGGTKYMVIQGEAGAVIRGKKVLPHSSFLIPHSSYVLIISFFLFCFNHARMSMIDFIQCTIMNIFTYILISEM